jgi:hypothetical protein
LTTKSTSPELRMHSHRRGKCRHKQ